MGVAPYIEGEGMLRVGNELSGTLLRGVLPDREPRVSDIGQKLIAGRFEDLESGEFRMVIGVELARLLGVRLGDTMDLQPGAPCYGNAICILCHALSELVPQGT